MLFSIQPQITMRICVPIRLLNFFRIRGHVFGEPSRHQPLFPATRPITLICSSWVAVRKIQCPVSSFAAFTHHPQAFKLADGFIHLIVQQNHPFWSRYGIPLALPAGKRIPTPVPARLQRRAA